MNEHTGSSSSPSDADAYLRYRSLSLLAVAAFGTAILSIPALILPWMLPLPTISFLLAIVAIACIRRRESELAGRGLALSALLLSLVVLICGTGRAWYEYSTELPPGFIRVGWSQLQPSPDHPHLPVPPFAIELNDQEVFVKGYIYPDERGAQLKEFVLVPDLGTCCFGGQPALTDMILVTLADPLRTRYSRTKHKLAGTLRVDTQLKPVSGVDGVYYRLDARYIDGKYSD